MNILQSAQVNLPLFLKQRIQAQSKIPQYNSDNYFYYSAIIQMFQLSSEKHSPFITKTLLILLYLLQYSQSFYFRQLAVTLSDFRIRNYATYTILLSRNQYSNFSLTPWDNNSVPSNASIMIQFPVQYSPQDLTLASCQSMLVQTDNGNFTPTPTIKITNNNIVLSTFLSVPTFVDKVTIKLINIKNPEPALKTSSFIGTIGDDTSTPGDTLSLVQLLPGTLATCSATFTQGYVNRNDNLTIAFSSLSFLDPNTILKVDFPASYVRDPSNTSIVISSVSCMSTLQTYGISCNSTSSSVNVYNSLPISGSVATSFQINNIQAPPSTQPIDLITIYTYNSNLIPYDSCQTTLSNLQPIVISDFSASFGTNQLTVDAQIPINFTIPLYNALFTTDSMVLSFSAIYAPVYQLISIIGYSVNTSLVYTLNSNTSNSINISSNVNISTGRTLYLNLSQIYAPPSSALFFTTNLAIYQNGYIKALGSLSYSVAPNIVSASNIRTSVSSTSLLTLSRYTINFTPTNPLTASGMLTIHFPSEIQLGNSLSSAKVNGVSVSKSVLTGQNGVNLTVLPAINKGTSTSIEIQSLANPSSTDPITTNLTLRYYYSTNPSDLVFYLTYIPTQLIYTAQETIVFSVDSSSQVVMASNVSWTFSITTLIKIPMNGSIIIIFHDIVSLSSNYVPTSCILTNTVNSSVSSVLTTLCEIVYNSTISSFQLNIKKISQTLSNTFNLTVTNAFTNPLSTEPTNYFGIITYSALGKQLQRSSSLALTYLTISQPAPFVVFNLSRTSSRNSELANYTFYAQQLSDFSTGSNDINSLLLTLPTELDINQATCSPVCSINSYTITLTLNNADLVGKRSVTFTVYNIGNAASFAPPSDNVMLKSRLNELYFYSQASNLNNFKDLTNSLPSALTVTASYTDFKLGGLNQLSLTINTSNPSAYYYVLTLSSQFSATAPTFTLSDTTYNCTYDSSKRIIVITKTESTNPASVSLNLIIKQFYNPIAYPSTPLISTLLGFSLSHFQVNEYNGSQLNWMPDCTFPCQTCLSTNSSMCTSCYQNTTISNFSHYYPAKNQCLASCLLGQMSMPNGTCVDCTNNCMQCQVITSNCTACNSSTLYAYFFNNSCLKASQCPQRYYPSSTYQCLACQFPCFTCTSPNDCLICANGTYKYGNFCMDSCPLNFTIQNNITATCDLCSSICATCQATIDSCTSCGSNTVWYNNSCQSNCDPPLYILNISCVQNCVSPCQTCDIYATFCLTCIPDPTNPLYQYNGSCLAHCPALYFQNFTTFQCVACSTLTYNCNNCKSNLNCSVYGGSVTCIQTQLVSCLTCNPNYSLLYNQTLEIFQCLSSVPDGYASVNGIATKCVNPCLTCSLFTNNCTRCLTLNFFQGQCLPLCPNLYYSATISILFNAVDTTTKSCQICSAPCLTCTSQLECLSCRNNSYFDGVHSCVLAQNCPLYTYANSTFLKCSPCMSPCLTCSTYFKCQSCQTSTFLYNISQCVSNCPRGYFQNTTANLCNMCISPCQSCDQFGDICLTCNNETYYYSYNYSCLGDCPLGFLKNELDRICQNCSLPCVQCNTTTCYRCSYQYHNAFYYLSSGSCETGCPDGYFPYNNQSNPECRPCNISCSTCSSAVLCTSCNTIAGYKKLSNSSECRLQCPEDQPVLTVLQKQIECQPCSDGLCFRCTPNNKCIKCINNTLILSKGLCSINCPINFTKYFNATANSSQCLPNAVAEALAEGITFTLPISFPCSILAGLLCCLSFLIKFYQHCCKNNQKVLIFTLLSSALAIPEFCGFVLSAASYFLLRYHIFLEGPTKWDVFLWIYLSCILLTLVTGVYVVIIQCKIIHQDKIYYKWERHANCLQKTFQYIVNMLSLLNFKMSHILWCGIKSLPLLQTSKKLIFFTKPSGFSLLIALTFTANSIVNITYHQTLKWIYIDCMAVVLLSTLFSLLALRRPTDFFIHHLDQDNNLPINKRVVSADQYLVVSGMNPIGNYQDKLYSKLRKRQGSSDFMNQSLNEELSSSSRSARTPSLLISHKSSSVRLQNFSLQCTIMQDSDHLHKDEISNEFNSDEITNQVYSIECEPGGKSSYLEKINDKTEPVHRRENVSFRQVSQQSDISEMEHPTNLGMLEIGENESCSADNDEQFQKAKFLLPIEFRRYQLFQEAVHNYSQAYQPKEVKQIEESSFRRSQKAQILDNSSISAEVHSSKGINSIVFIQEGFQNKKAANITVQQKLLNEEKADISINSAQAQQNLSQQYGKSVKILHLQGTNQRQLQDECMMKDVSAVSIIPIKIKPREQSVVGDFGSPSKRSQSIIFDSFIDQVSNKNGHQFRKDLGQKASQIEISNESVARENISEFSNQVLPTDSVNLSSKQIDAYSYKNKPHSKAISIISPLQSIQDIQNGQNNEQYVKNADGQNQQSEEQLQFMNISDEEPGQQQKASQNESQQQYEEEAEQYEDEAEQQEDRVDQALQRNVSGKLQKLGKQGSAQMTQSNKIKKKKSISQRQQMLESGAFSKNLSKDYRKSKVSAKQQYTQQQMLKVSELQSLQNSKVSQNSKISQNKSRKLKESTKSIKNSQNKPNTGSMIPKQSVQSVEWDQVQRIDEQQLQRHSGDGSELHSQNEQYLTKKMNSQQIANQFRIKTKKKKKKTGKGQQKELVYLVDNEKFHTLKSQFTVLRKEIRKNQRLKKHFEQQSSAIYKEKRESKEIKEVSREKRKNSGSKVQEVYLSRVSPSKIFDGK